MLTEKEIIEWNMNNDEIKASSHEHYTILASVLNSFFNSAKNRGTCRCNKACCKEE